MSFINFINFNQDASCLSVGSSKGFRIYYTDPFGKCYEHDEGNINIVEMLFSTSLVALVLSPRRLQIQNTKRQSLLCELTFLSAILAVKLNRKRLAVILEDFIYLYDISNMKLLYTLETSPNPDAICFLSPSSENCYLALPLPHKSTSVSQSIPEHLPPKTSSTTYLPPISGSVLLFDTIKLEALTVIDAHRAPISCLSINDNGTLMATASDKGTIIRIFSIPSASKLFQFRRGTYPSRIFSMAFNLASTLLAVSSASETVHVFKLQAPPPYSPSKDSAYPSSSADSIYADSTTSDRPVHHRRLSGDSSPPHTPDSTDTTQSPPTHSQTPFAKHTGSFGSLLRRSSQTIGKTVAGAVGGYLPTAVTEIWEPMRDFAFMKLPKPGSNNMNPGGGQGGAVGQGGGFGGAGGGYGAYGGGSWAMRSVVAMSSQSPHVMVATSEGAFLVYGIDMEKGGEGWLVRQCSLWDSADDGANGGNGNGGDGADDM